MELHVCYWWECVNEENKIKLVKRKAFVDSTGIENANLEDEFCSKVLQVSW